MAEMKSWYAACKFKQRVELSVIQLEPCPFWLFEGNDRVKKVNPQQWCNDDRQTAIVVVDRLLIACNTKKGIQ
jgi:hypothetical protein